MQAKLEKVRLHATEDCTQQKIARNKRLHATEDFFLQSKTKWMTIQYNILTLADLSCLRFQQSFTLF